MMNPSQTILQNSPSNKTKKNINQSHSIRPNTTSSSSTFGNRNNMTNKKAPYHSQTYQQQQHLYSTGVNSNNELLCNNCGKHGHLFYICKIPITSIGVIAYRRYNNENQYLMIRRKDTLGYIDFLRGKFSLDQKQYIMNMILQMTNREKEILMQKYCAVREGNIVNGVKERVIELINGITIEETKEYYDLKSLIEESKLYCNWDEPEWGFPKGRRNSQESDYDCAVREFSEETGYPSHVLTNVRNIVPMEETFTGSNYNSYRHKYYLMNISYENSISEHKYQKSEVSGMNWMNLSQCLAKIRPYNLEKIQVIKNIDHCLQKTRVFSIIKI
jgi:ADP-ribose pyrophosphatase YjhB (NUDIX family)